MTKYDKAVSVCFSGHRSVPFVQAEGVEAMSQIGDSQGVCRRLPVFLLWHGNGI